MLILYVERHVFKFYNFYNFYMSSYMCSDFTKFLQISMILCQATTNMSISLLNYVVFQVEPQYSRKYQPPFIWNSKVKYVALRFVLSYKLEV